MCEDKKYKVCNVCQLTKEISLFSKAKFGKDGHRNNCKSCGSYYVKKYREDHPEKIKKKTQDQIRQNNAYSKRKRLLDPEYREKFLIRSRERRNTELYRSKARIQRKKWLENPSNRIAKNLRDRIRSALDGRSKAESTLTMTGIPFEELKKYLESNFIEGMTWENYGEWHIDHIIPCSYFDMSKSDHQKICFYYKNLQPMWAKENISKGTKVDIDIVQNLLAEIKKDLNIL